jgi:uncharacterized membrane protein
MNPQDLLNYFLSPTKTGYDLPKTFAYSFVFIIAAYIIFKLLKKANIKIDKRLAVAITPYVIFGGILRSLEDAGVASSYWFITPGIYFLVFSIVALILLISIFLQRKKNIPYFKFLFTVGLLLISFTIPNVKPINLYGVFLVGLFLLPWILISYFIKRWELTNRIVSVVQMFDATTTFVALNFFRYKEQHVLPKFFISLFGPVSFIFLKLIGVVAALVLIDKFSTDKEFNNYLKLCIGILGGATGIRDLFTLFSLV